MRRRTDHSQGMRALLRKLTSAAVNVRDLTVIFRSGKRKEETMCRVERSEGVEKEN